MKWCNSMPRSQNYIFVDLKIFWGGGGGGWVGVVGVYRGKEKDGNVLGEKGRKMGEIRDLSPKRRGGGGGEGVGEEPLTLLNRIARWILGQHFEEKSYSPRSAKIFDFGVSEGGV